MPEKPGQSVEQQSSVNIPNDVILQALQGFFDDIAPPATIAPPTGTKRIVRTATQLRDDREACRRRSIVDILSQRQDQLEALNAGLE